MTRRKKLCPRCEGMGMLTDRNGKQKPCPNCNGARTVDADT